MHNIIVSNAEKQALKLLMTLVEVSCNDTEKTGQEQQKQILMKQSVKQSAREHSSWKFFFNRTSLLYFILI